MIKPPTSHTQGDRILAQECKDKEWTFVPKVAEPWGENQRVSKSENGMKKD